MPWVKRISECQLKISIQKKNAGKALLDVWTNETYSLNFSDEPYGRKVNVTPIKTTHQVSVVSFPGARVQISAW